MQSFCFAYRWCVFFFEYKRLVIFACLLINMSLSLILISHKKRWVRSLFLVIILLTFSRIFSTLMTNIQAIDRIREFFSGLYFLCITRVLLYDLYKEKNLIVDTLFAVFSGFILLCYAFGSPWCLWIKWFLILFGDLIQVLSSKIISTLVLSLFWQLVMAMFTLEQKWLKL